MRRLRPRRCDHARQPVDHAVEDAPGEGVVQVRERDVGGDRDARCVGDDQLDVLAAQPRPRRLEVEAGHACQLWRMLDADHAPQWIAAGRLQHDPALTRAEIEQDVVRGHGRARQGRPERQPMARLVPAGGQAGRGVETVGTIELAGDTQTRRDLGIAEADRALDRGTHHRVGARERQPLEAILGVGDCDRRRASP